MVISVGNLYKCEGYKRYLSEDMAKQVRQDKDVWSGDIKDKWWSEGDWWGWHVEKTRKQSLAKACSARGGGERVKGQVIVINFGRVEKD